MGVANRCFVVVCLTLGGCYSGTSPVDGTDGPDPAPTDGAEETSEGGAGDETGEGETDGSPQAGCEEVDAGPTALRRLTRRQYGNTVRDLLGVSDYVTDALVADEKVGVFDANGIATVTDLSVEK